MDPRPVASQGQDLFCILLACFIDHEGFVPGSRDKRASRALSPITPRGWMLADVRDRRAGCLDPNFHGVKYSPGLSPFKR